MLYMTDSAESSGLQLWITETRSEISTDLAAWLKRIEERIWKQIEKLESSLLYCCLLSLNESCKIWQGVKIDPSPASRTIENPLSRTVQGIFLLPGSGACPALPQSAISLLWFEQNRYTTQW